MPVKNRFAELLPEITAWRHDFHENPELLYEVHRTAAKVADLLRGFGCDEVVEGIGRTGVVGVIRGRSDKGGRAIGLRADMDALPIHEQTGLPYASKVAGKMHACGHDGHTAMLLGAARYLAETRNFDGTAVVIFQPAEEGGGGGRAMVEDGLVARFGIDEFYSMHNHPGLDVGRFAIRTGPIMAAADQFQIILTGTGGHAGKPHESNDTMVIAAQIITALQTIVSRTVDPLKQAVVSVSTLTTDSPTHNVLPQTIVMTGTVRTMEPGVRDMVEARLVQIVTGIAAAFGATAAVDYTRGYPPTVNAAEQTDFAADVARAIAGAGQVDPDTPALMAAEDFSYMLNERPGAYIFLGNGDSASLHQAGYNFDDSAIPFGSSWFAEVIERRLPVA